MAANSNIEWTDTTWNPVAGCSIVSPGCHKCYAMTMAKRLAAMGQTKYVGTVDKNGRWTGKINTDEKALAMPLSWKKPRRVFVNSMSDLFHENVPDEFIDLVFVTMAICPQHTFQVLTKRPERMRDYMRSRDLGVIFEAEKHHYQSKRAHSEATELEISVSTHNILSVHDNRKDPPWPLPNVWLGVSVEDQKRADERIPLLLQTPAAVRFLSMEPMLGGVDLLRVEWPGLAKPGTSSVPHRVDVLRCGYWEDRDVFYKGFVNHSDMPGKIDWVIVGGESGHGARPMHPDWARSIRDQCQEAGVPFFMKQMDKKEPIPTDLFIREFPAVK